MTWNPPALSFGWLVALIVLILTGLLKAMGMIDLPAAMLIAAVCAVRL